MKKMKTFICAFIVLYFTHALAMPIKPPHFLEKSGAIRGGQSEQYVSLLDARRSADPKIKTERLIFDWGDRSFDSTVKGGYYQIEYREKSAQVMMSFALTLNTKFEAEAFRKKMENGLYVKKASLDYDSVAHSVIVHLQLRNKVKVKVTEMDGVAKKSTAKLVIDLIGTK